MILLQCGHPSGLDLNVSQWRRLASLMKDKELIPFFDVANIGLVSGSPEDDAYAIGIFVEMGVEFLVAQSFSKNFGCMFSFHFNCL